VNDASQAPRDSGSQRLADYLLHIAEAIDRIHRYTQGLTQAAFTQNTLVQDAVIRNLEVVGEASHNVQLRYPLFAAAHPELPLAAAYQMRNAVAHGYFKVDWGIVWNTVHGDLPNLRQQVQQVHAALSTDGSSSNPCDSP
jgi:uncharacterized protein with HEPN domain